MTVSLLFRLLLLGGLIAALGGVPRAAAQDAGVPGDTLRLADVVQRALANNYQTQIARNDVDIAANDYAVGNAGFLPTLSVGAGYNGTISDTRQEFISGDPQDVTGARSTRYAADAQLEWTLFDGLSRFATYNRLAEELGQQQAAADALITSVLADVVVTYYAVARQQQQLQVFEEAVAISQERLRIAELRREVGSASDLEVRQARVDLNADRAAALRQEVTLANTKAALNRLLARRGAATTFNVADSIDVALGLQQPALLAAADERNPALRRARRAQRAAEWERQEVRAERLPTVDANVGYGYSRSESESGFLRSSRSYDLTYGLTLSFDVFDGLNRRRRLENAAVRQRTAELVVEDVRTQLTADLTSAFTNYRNRLELVALERENLEATSANVAIALERFELGEITSVELREVQEQLIQAESRLLAAQFEAKQAEVTLLQLSGQLRDRLPGARP
jgi:outer membrane protein TolC